MRSEHGLEAIHICAGLLLGFVLCMPVGFAELAPDNFVGAWTFDEGSGKTAQDLSLQANDGTLVNSPTWVQGKVGNALEFDGGNDYVEFDLPSVFPNIASSDFTVFFWANVQDISGTDTVWTRILEARHDNLNYLQFTIQINDGELGVNLMDAGTERTFMVDTPISADTWYHIAAVWDADQDNLELYLDGGLQSTPGTVPASPGTERILNLGRRSDGSEMSYFRGIIDEFAILNIALTAEDIQAVMDGGLKEFAAISPGGKLTTIWGALKS